MYLEIYQVVIGYYFIGESQETCCGYYSILEKAEQRKQVVIKKYNEDSNHVFINKISIDSDIEN